MVCAVSSMERRLFLLHIPHETTTRRVPTLTFHTGLRLIGAVAVVLPTTFWLLSSGQKADKHNDHEQQRALRASHPGIINTPHKDIQTKADGSESDLPEDAPNRPDNREKVCRLGPLNLAQRIPCQGADYGYHQIERKLSEKPATKRVDPMK